jgi:predicted nicotinamide N-methyase
MPSISDEHIPGGWTEREVAVGPHSVRLLTPTDPDELLKHLESAEGTMSPHFADPYWSKLWPAAGLLAAAIVRSPPRAGTRVLELGCGSGLVGIAAAACGCDVTFSDYVPLAVSLAVENAARNGFANARGCVLDWRQPQEERFPLIVAADVTYDRSNLDPLLNVLDHMLAADGVAWFGDAGRSPAGDFVKRAGERGWNVSLFDEHDRPVSGVQLCQYRQIILTRSDGLQ